MARLNYPLSRNAVKGRNNNSGTRSHRTKRKDPDDHLVEQPKKIKKRKVKK